MNAGVLVLLGVTTMVLGGIFLVGRRIVRQAEGARPEGRAYGEQAVLTAQAAVGPTFRSRLR